MSVRDHQHTMLLFGAYRESGILPGEEMEQIIRTTSVITSILYPERQTNVRECGARVTCIKVIPLVLRILCNFSALPQYLERLARGMRTPCAILLLQICTYCIGASGFGFVRSTKKEIGTLFGVPISFLGDPYGNRTHVTAVKGPCLNRLTNGPYCGSGCRI